MRARLRPAAAICLILGALQGPVEAKPKKAERGQAEKKPNSDCEKITVFRIENAIAAEGRPGLVFLMETSSMADRCIAAMEATERSRYCGFPLSGQLITGTDERTKRFALDIMKDACGK